VSLVVLFGWLPNSAVGRDRPIEFKFNYTFNPVEIVVNRVLDRVIDFTLESVGLKEAQAELENRLRQEIEKSSAALKSEQKEKLRELREEIRKCASRDDLKNLATKFKNNLKEVNQRLDSAEDDLEWLKVKDEDRDNGTKLREDPKHFLARGEKYLTYKEHFKALACARIASRLDGTLAEPYLLQGRVYAAKGAGDVARACFDQAITIAPKFAPAWRMRGDARWAASEYTGSIEDYGQAVTLDPKDGWSWGHRASARVALDQFAAAIDDANQALKLDRNDTFARFQRGRAYILSSQPAKAVADFDECVLARPEDPDCHDHLGFAHLKNYNFDKAQKSLEKALKLKPDHALAHCHLTQMWSWKGDYAQAVATGKRAVELLGQKRNTYGAYESWSVHYEYGYALWVTGNTDEALKQFNESIIWNYKNTEGYQALAYGYAGVLYGHKGQHDFALIYLNESLRLKPDNAYLLSARARVHNFKRNFDKAIDDATAAIKLNAIDGSAFFQRAFARHEKKQYSEAVADYSEVIRLNPKDVAAFSNRGSAQRMLGKSDKALEDYTEALRLDPNFVTARGGRAQIYQALGKRADAEADYEKLLKDPTWKDTAIFALIEISPNNAELLKTFHPSTSAYGAYSVLQKVVYAPDDKASYGAYSNYGYSTTTEYAGVKGLPAGYWVYVEPYWYIWAAKK
jgi:tetratricopeptide (TPR) repeat protein